MSGAQLLAFTAVAVTGFTACAEFGSYAFVHPVLRRLEVRAHITVEQGLIRTFGRVMPVLMTVSLLLVIAWATTAGAAPTALRAGAVGAWAFGLATTVAVNVGINSRTAGWDPAASPDHWRAVRRRWEAYQGIRSWAFLISSLLLTAGTTGQVR
ncbi:DUF1772 domain-containing protein [Paenibacillus sp. TRM 82003]|uniref:DUF1772 domain-containing protein n=1 Tax=Kineococcus sp. TRM81007 TaxID=2925831 RepID=UPI001F56DD13|nr:DUF1772 domain-containing protein [Kineococcus sp. TRM81007]MCI2237675.1 DUF1772 domain-containing protein [Kineococcus sp. TRM81007]MCI3921693.1 DUF1772 domain-containing protein [Paenibacillus sp. TRM 82003]